jgi:hypothetical protein
MDPNDTDYASSGYDTGSTSLSSTVNEYVFENGTSPLIETPKQKYHTRLLTPQGADIMHTMERTRICYRPTRQVSTASCGPVEAR